MLLVGRARLVLHAPLAHGVDELDAVQQRRRQPQVGVQRLDGLLLGRVLGQQALGADRVEPALQALAGLGPLLLDGPLEQPELVAQVHLDALEVAGGRREVVRAHRGHGLHAVVAGVLGPVALGLEPEHRGAEHAAGRQLLAHPRLHRAEVLADHDDARALGLERQDAEHGLVVVVDIGALGGPVALRDPPQPEQTHDVVDPDAARVAEDPAQHLPPRAVAGLRQTERMPRRLAPVLALLVVHVGGGTHGDAAGQGPVQRPGIGPVLGHAHGQVMHHADRHARRDRRVLSAGQLLVEQPLQPDVEVDAALQARAGLDGVRRVRTGGLVLPQRRVLADLLADRAPQREVLQLLPALGGEAAQLLLALC